MIIDTDELRKKITSAHNFLLLEELFDRKEEALKHLNYLLESFDELNVDAFDAIAAIESCARKSTYP